MKNSIWVAKNLASNEFLRALLVSWAIKAARRTDELVSRRSLVHLSDEDMDAVNMRCGILLMRITVRKDITALQRILRIGA